MTLVGLHETTERKELQRTMGHVKKSREADPLLLRSVSVEVRSASDVEGEDDLTALDRLPQLTLQRSQQQQQQ